MKRLWLAALLIAAAPGGSDGDPASYRVRLPVRPAAGATVQRLALPAPVLAAAQRGDLADVRVFDARGRAMPIARAPVAAVAGTRVSLPAQPILGPADGMKVTGMSLRLDDQGRARLAALDGTPVAGSESMLLGALFDARAIAGGVRSVTLDADVPVAQPVTFTLAASRDLKTWRPIGEQVVYRRAAAPAAIDIALDDADLRRDYLRVTWGAGTRLLSPVAVRGAILVTRSGEADTVAIDAALPPPADAHAIDIAIPFATPIASIAIVPDGDDLVVPVRILARSDRERPWVALGSGTARRDAPAEIGLSGGSFAMLRIEADKRTPGFTTPPAVRFGFRPRAIAFLAAGTPPFVLAAGHEGAADIYLPLASLVGVNRGPLPEATIAAGPATVLRLDLAQVEGDRRQVLLWAILLGATGLLAAMAWTLWRRTKAAA